MRNVLVVLLVLAVAGCCSVKKNCPMKKAEEAPVVVEEVVAVAEPAVVEAAAPVAEAVAPVVEEVAAPAVEAPVAQ